MLGLPRFDAGHLDRVPAPLRAWYAYAFLYELAPIYPLYGIMFLDGGIPPVGFAVLLICWSVAAIAFEVPSGALADRFPRKWVLAAAAGMKGICYAVWLACPSFAGYAAGFVIWGLAGALRSGSTESYVHDVLAGLGREREFTLFYGRGRAYGRVGVVVALLAGGALGEFGYTVPLVTSIIGLAAATVLAAVGLARATPCHHEAGRGYAAVLRDGVVEARSNRGVLLLVGIVAVFLAIPLVFDEFTGPLLDEKGFRPLLVGAGFALCMIASLFGLAFAHRFESKGVRGLLWMQVPAGAALVLAGIWPGVGALVCVMAYYFLYGVTDALAAGRLQREIRGRSRATVTSVAGLATQAVCVAGSLAIGVAATAGNVAGGAMLLGGLTVGAAAAWLAMMSARAR
ncbi:MAG: hypothetical protein PWP23_173 [Candidatus Sumerlaeota bacterium]|nr:hypothetical protein [Candidatus Sumerlaeota bacterium]